MERSLKNYINSIQFRITAPILLIILLVGFGVSTPILPPFGLITWTVLFLAIAVISIYLKNVIQSPVNRIITPMQKGELPEYRGINEFQFLSNSIREMKIAIKEKNERIEELNRELLKAKKDVETADELKNQFLANMSHEIRTPLNGILGTADLCLETEMNREQKDYLDMIKTSGLRLHLVVNDILDFSRIESGKMSLDIMTFKLRERLLDTFNLMKVSASKKKLGFSCQIEDDVPNLLTGDPKRLSQVIFNLLSNAIKFTDKGEIGISVKSDNSSGEEGSVLLHCIVSDTGIGIPPEKQDQILNAFTQADSSHSRRYGGSGLGLSISSGLARLMGGEIWFHSIAGKGSRFHFTAKFRAEYDLIKEEVPPSQENSLLSGPDANGNEYHILLVEDERINRMLAEKIMVKQGWKVTPARNGEEALTAYKTGRFDLIVMDIQMPVMDGFTATQAIRNMEEEKGGHIPIIALTAHAIKGDREKCLAAGMDDYLSKPIASDKFISTISRYLYKKKPFNFYRSR
jgi:signal transduction histidine kinase/ActR/RegA family two-component response regulator